jgi:hypothetical protein
MLLGRLVVFLFLFSERNGCKIAHEKHNENQNDQRQFEAEKQELHFSDVEILKDEYQEQNQHRNVDAFFKVS